jgi:hypothetical protein
LDETRPVGRLTVQRAVADYIDYLSTSGKNTNTAESCAVTYILPKLGHCEVMSLTSPQLRQWVAWVAETPAQNGGVAKQQRKGEDEQIRRHRASANRHVAFSRPRSIMPSTQRFGSFVEVADLEPCQFGVSGSSFQCGTC